MWSVMLDFPGAGPGQTARSHVIRNWAALKNLGFCYWKLRFLVGFHGEDKGKRSCSCEEEVKQAGDEGQVPLWPSCFLCTCSSGLHASAEKWVILFYFIFYEG